MVAINAPNAPKKAAVHIARDLSSGRALFGISRSAPGAPIKAKVRIIREASPVRVLFPAECPGAPKKKSALFIERNFALAPKALWPEVSRAEKVQANIFGRIGHSAF